MSVLPHAHLSPSTIHLTKWFCYRNCLAPKRKEGYFMFPLSLVLCSSHSSPKVALSPKLKFSSQELASVPVHTFSSVQSLSQVLLFVTPLIEECQASLSITNTQSSLKLMSIESVMPSTHLILCRPLLLLPQIPPSIRVFSNEKLFA